MRFAFCLCVTFALVAFCGGWGWAAVICPLMWAALFWQMDNDRL